MSYLRVGQQWSFKALMWNVNFTNLGRFFPFPRDQKDAPSQRPWAVVNILSLSSQQHRRRSVSEVETAVYWAPIRLPFIPQLHPRHENRICSLKSAQVHSMNKKIYRLRKQYASANKAIKLALLHQSANTSLAAFKERLLQVRQTPYNVLTV